MSTPATQAEERLELLLQTKDFPPPAEFAAQAEIVDPAVYEQASADPQAWWAGHGDRVAFHWHGEEGEQRDLTYAELLADVQRLANGLKARGVKKGDVVGIYLPMIPEVVVAMLACARIGAPHNVVFGGFSPSA